MVYRSRTAEPSRCSGPELARFERMVRLGFDGSDDTLPHRIRAARLLGFGLDGDTGPVAIAGLKRPGADYTAGIFSKAACDSASGDWNLELGWVYVDPAHRGEGIGRALSAELLQAVPGRPVFATTRPDNAPMIRILESLGFERVGRPFRRRSQTLTLFLRPAP